MKGEYNNNNNNNNDDNDNSNRGAIFSPASTPQLV